MQSAWLGFAYGMGLFGAGVTWLYVSLHDFGAMPPVLAAFALVILCAYLSLYPALCGWLVFRMRMASPHIWALAAAAAWMLTEWLRGALFTGFPWLALGYSQAPDSPLAGFAPTLGVYGVSLILVWSAALLCLWFAKAAAAVRIGLLLGIIWLGGLGLQSINWVEPIGEPLTVSLLQGNIEQDLKWREDHVEKTMLTYAELILESESRLIVTPEISIPLFNDAVPPDYLDYLAEHARETMATYSSGWLSMPRMASIPTTTVCSVLVLHLNRSTANIIWCHSANSSRLSLFLAGLSKHCIFHYPTSPAAVPISNRCNWRDNRLR